VRCHFLFVHCTAPWRLSLYDYGSDIALRWSLSISGAHPSTPEAEVGEFETDAPRGRDRGRTCASSRSCEFGEVVEVDVEMHVADILRVVLVTLE
jgi:hypothetical protein